MSSETAAQRVFREDVVLFVNGCFAATGQAEFHRSAQEGVLSMEFVHEYMLHNYRRVYALTAGLGINDYNRALILRNLLQHPEPERPPLENELIRTSLRALPPQRVYRLFGELRRRRVNNRRTRATIRDYVVDRNQLSFDALKYRKGLSHAARHARVPLPGELGPFLFRWRKARRFKTPLLEAWRAAHYSRDAVYELPYSVAVGFANKLGIPRRTFLNRIAPKMTRGERERLHRSADKHRVDLHVDLSEMPLLRLCSLLVSMPSPERRERADELNAALDQAACGAFQQAEAVRAASPRVVAVLDNSYSATGSRERHLRPLAATLGADALLRQAFESYAAVWLLPPDSPVQVRAWGQTNLADAVLRGLEQKPELLLIVSDGWDNDPPGATEAILDLHRRQLDPDGRVTVIHANPVFDARRFEPRRVSAAVPTIGFRDPIDLLAMLPFARFASGQQGAGELLTELERRARTFIESGAAHG